MLDSHGGYLLVDRIVGSDPLTLKNSQVFGIKHVNTHLLKKIGLDNFGLLPASIFGDLTINFSKISELRNIKLFPNWL